jgi:hypothetical protein
MEMRSCLLVVMQLIEDDGNSFAETDFKLSFSSFMLSGLEPPINSWNLLGFSLCTVDDKQIGREQYHFPPELQLLLEGMLGWDR